MARLAAIEQQYGLPKSTLAGMYGIESNFGRAKDRPGSQFQGGFQLGNAVRRQYGVANPQDFEQSAIGAAKYAADNKKFLMSAIGREPTAAELYLAHQQGAGGARKLLTNPNQPAGMLTNPNFISSNAGDPNAPASQFSQKFGDMFNRKVAEASGVPMDQALAYSGQQPTGPQDAAGQALQGAFGAPGGGSSDNPFGDGETSSSPSGWDAAGNIGNGLMAAGAALMARDNPSGASALMAGIKQANKKSNAWNTSINPKTGQAVRYNEETGQMEVRDIPGYKLPAPDETTAQQDFKFWQSMPPGPEKDAFGKAHKFVDDEVASDPDSLKLMGTDYLVNGNQQALNNMSKKDRVEAVRLAKDQFKKDTGSDYDPTDLALRRGAYLELQAEQRKFGQMLAPTQAAHDRLQADIQIAKEQVSKIQDRLNTGPYRWNQFMQMTSKELQDAGYADLAKAREAIYNVERGYSSVQANGMRGGDTVHSQERAKELINGAMTPDVLLGQVGKDGKRSGGLLDFMGESSGRILKSVTDGQETLRKNWKKGAKTFAGTYEATAAQEDAEIDKRLGQTAQPAAPAPAAPASPAAPQYKIDELIAERQRRDRAAGRLTGTMQKAR